MRELSIIKDELPAPVFSEDLGGLRQHGTRYCPICHKKALHILSGWKGSTAHIMTRCGNSECDLRFDYREAYPSADQMDYHVLIQKFEDKALTLFYDYVAKTKIKKQLELDSAKEWEEGRTTNPRITLEEEKNGSTNRQGQENNEGDEENLRAGESQASILRDDPRKKDYGSGGQESPEEKGSNEEIEEVVFHGRHPFKLYLNKSGEPMEPEKDYFGVTLEDPYKGKLTPCCDFALCKSALCYWIIATIATILTVFVFINFVHADEPYRCIDALGLTTDADCDTLEATLSGGEMIGMFMDVDGFKPAMPCIKRLVEHRKIKAFRGEGAWSDVHHFKTDNASLDSYADLFTPLEPIAKKIPVYASGACEHDLRSTYAKILRAKTLQRCPHCIYVNTPMPNRGDYIDSMNEVHGTAFIPRAFRQYPKGYSLDGTDFSQVDAQKWNTDRADGKYRCIWGFGNNKKYGHADNTPRSRRKVVPPRQYIQSQLKMTESRGATPVIPGTLDWKPGFLLKPAADNHPNDPKGWKVMFVLPSKYVNGLEILDVNKRLLTTAPYYAPYDGGGYRYYTRFYCSELAASAKGSSRSEYILLSVVRNVVDSKGKIKKVRDTYKASHPCFRKEVK